MSSKGRRIRYHVVAQRSGKAGRATDDIDPDVLFERNGDSSIRPAVDEIEWLLHPREFRCARVVRVDDLVERPS